MIDLKDPNIKLSDFNVIEAPQRPLAEKVFVPFFRVKGQNDSQKKYEVVKMPKEWYELFHKRVKKDEITIQS